MALHRGDDELVKDGEGRVVGNWLNCANGHRALLIPGVESGSMMPLGLHAHPPAGTYGESSPESFAAAKAAGAALWVAHVLIVALFVSTLLGYVLQMIDYRRGF